MLDAALAHPKLNGSMTMPPRADMCRRTSLPSRILLWLCVVCLVVVTYPAALIAQTPVDWAMKSLAEIQKAAEAGDATAQGALANAYLTGDKVAIDPVQAVRWYKASAEQNDPISQFALGMLYEEGNGVNRSMTEAVKWYRAAAERGVAEAQYNLGACYATGDGVEIDHAESVKWYRKAAEQREVRAETQLGRAYREGLGVKKDQAEALRWFRRAAYQEEPSAQFFVGLAYFEGDGTERDTAEAIKWFQRSAEQNYPDAQYFLGQATLKGEGIEANPSTAIEWFRKAAQQGHTHARYLLGQAYKNGQGVAANRDEAIKWLRLAAANSHAGALKTLIEMGITNVVYKPIAFATPMTTAQVTNEVTHLPATNLTAHAEAAPKPATTEVVETNKAVAALAPPIKAVEPTPAPAGEGVVVPYGLLAIGVALLGVIALTSTLLLLQVRSRLKHMEGQVQETRLQLAQAGNHLNSLLRYVEARAMTERAEKLAMTTSQPTTQQQIAATTPATTQYKARRSATPSAPTPPAN